MLKLSIISPDETLFEGEVEAVFLPGTKGAFEILPDHAPIISSLTSGNVRYRQNGEETSVAISSGFMKCLKNTVSVCIEK